MSNLLIPGYELRAGSTLERALLLKFLQRTDKEAYPKQDFSHLAMTVKMPVKTYLLSEIFLLFLQFCPWVVCGWGM